MAKAAMPPKDQDNTEEAIQQLEASLADVPDSLADLYRDGGGYSIGMIFLPELSKPTEVQVVIKGSAGEGSSRSEVDSFKVTLDKENPGTHAMDILNHPTNYSEKLLVYLGGKEKKEN